MTEQYQIRKGEKLQWSLWVRTKHGWTVLEENDSHEILQKKLRSIKERKNIKG